MEGLGAERAVVRYVLLDQEGRLGSVGGRGIDVNGEKEEQGMNLRLCRKGSSTWEPTGC
jgi:hypothetical protein